MNRSMKIRTLCACVLIILCSSADASEISDRAERFIIRATSGTSSAAVDAMAHELSADIEAAPELIRQISIAPGALSECLAAELLFRLAEAEKLTDPLAELASTLLVSDDRFAASMAEWAIAIKVGIANNGPAEVYPSQQTPDWYQLWTSLDSDFHVDANYVRCAIPWGIHRSSSQCLSSARKYLSRAAGVLKEIRAAGDKSRIEQAEKDFRHAELLVARLEDATGEMPGDLRRHRDLWLETRRAIRPIVLANPAVDFDQIVFISRHAGHSLRNITGSQYPWTHKPGGDLLVKTGFDPDSPARPLLDDRLGPGHVHGMDLSRDSQRIVFGYAQQPDWPPSYDTGPNCSPYVFNLRKEQPPTHLFEIRLDGTGLKQITDHPLWSDFEPAYGPTGDIVFASDRSGRSSECGSFTSDHTVINIYSISPDGQNLRRLSDNKDIDRYPRSLDNGQIVYMRWEYQERHFTEVHSLWTVRPDGTMADALYKQHLGAPWSLRDARPIPGSDRLIAIAAGHHTLAHGAIVLIDPSTGPNDRRGMRLVTPFTVPQEGPPGGIRVDEGGVPEQGGLYQTPCALSETCFLASYSYNRPAFSTRNYGNDTQFGLYLIDVYGNKELIHRDDVYSSVFAMPVRRRLQPPVVASAEKGIDVDRSATCLIADVYQGLMGIERGRVRWIRISQRVGWPLDDRIGAMRYIAGNAFSRQFGVWAWSPVRVLGEVPVEPDGSAHFRVPADTAVYFQALDENRMEIRRMRSHISFQPAEVRGCVGCHETRPAAPAAEIEMPVAFARAASIPAAPHWGADRLLGYEWMIQPVFDRHCVRCHSGERPDGDLDLSGKIEANGYARSFIRIFADRADGKTSPTPNPLVAISDRFSGAGISQPLQFGSHRSRLVMILRDDPLHRKEVSLSGDEWHALVTWVDANAPYHDMFFNRRPDDSDSPRRDVRLRLTNVYSLPDE